MFPQPTRPVLALVTLLFFSGLAGLSFGGAGESPSRAAPTGGAPETAPGAALAFTLSDSGSDGSELNVGVTSTGVIFLGGWDTIARTTDEGATWTHHSTTPVVTFAADRVLIVDRDTDRVFVDDTTLACTVLAWSDDLGATWTADPVACGGGVTDHQKIAVGPRTTLADPSGLLYPNIVYVCANGLAHTPCSSSLDGGRTFLPSSSSQPVGCGFQGVPVADDAGTIFQPTTACGARVSQSTNNGLTWTTRIVPLGDPSRDTPDLATTPDGSLYFFATRSDWRPVYLHSPDGGLTWGSPIDVAPPGLVSSLFPVVTAGADGRIAIAFYGTFDDAAGWDHNPGNAPDTVRWQLFGAVITSADTPTPFIERLQVTTAADPIQYGAISKLGSDLNNIADYIDIDHTPDGRAVIGYVDGCPACAGAAGSTADDGWIAVQTSGPNLFG